MLRQPPDDPLGQPGAPEGPAQHAELVGVESAEHEPGRAAIAAHEAFPSLTELRHPAGPAGEEHEHAIGAEPTAGEEQGTRGRQVNPLQVLDHHGDRLAFLQGRDHREQFHADRERIRVRARAAGEQPQAGQGPGRHRGRPGRELLHQAVGQ